MRTLHTIQIILPLMLIVFAGCRKRENCPDSIPGTMRDLRGLDGCSWVIELNDNRRLEAINIADFKIPLKDGKRVRLTYESLPGTASFCMVGPVVKLNCMVEASVDH
jgi:hypothetical protein